MQIDSGLFHIRSSNQVIYAVDCGGRYALIDVGDESELDRKLALLRAEGIGPEQCAAVLITHFHGDHCGALAKLRGLTPVKVITHRLSVEPVTDVPPIDRVLVDETVDEGDTIEIGTRRFLVHHLPGHTPDSIAYQLDRRFFVGDITFEWAGIGWMDIHWGSCVSQYRESLNRLLALEPEVICPGHGHACALTPEMINRALGNLDILEKMDGSPLMVGRPAPVRGAGEARRTVRV